MIATSTEVQNRFGHYADIARTRPVRVTKNGKVIFTMQPTKPLDTMNEIRQVAASINASPDFDLRQAREVHRLERHCP
ncbi:hypothetical protein FWH13_01270 [Candidatus Saccharibacteria bacterium]|nr:hypothetical protein [Candidatus Saccharibacteria bacterium]